MVDVDLIKRKLLLLEDKNRIGDFDLYSNEIAAYIAKKSAK